MGDVKTVKDWQNRDVPADAPPDTWGAGIASIRAFLAGLRPEFRRQTLFLSLLREANAGIVPAPMDLRHPDAGEMPNESRG